MSKTSEMEATIRELRDIASSINDIANWLTGAFSGTEEAAPAPEPEKYFEIAGYEIPQKTFVAVIGLALIALICLVGFIVLTKKKKAETKKPDPDADYDEDYGDEIDIPEDTMDDDDFDE